MTFCCTKWVAMPTNEVVTVDAPKPLIAFYQCKCKRLGTPIEIEAQKHASP